MTEVTREMRVTEYRQGTRFSYARPRRRSGWTLIVAVLLVVGAIGVVGDRVAARLATDQLRAQLVAEMSNRGVEYRTIDVAIGGFPFLSQVAQGHYDEITIDMADVRLPPDTGRGATLPTLHVVATGVDADAAELVEGTAKVVADQVTGTAVVSYATLENIVDFSRFGLSNVRFTDSAGALQVTGTATLAGIAMPIMARADISVVEGDFQVRLRDAEVVGIEAPQIAKNFLDDLVQRTVTARLPQLPFSLTLDQVGAGVDGLEITATGRNVPLVT